MVYPACAGIHRREELLLREREGLPRMRGDPPQVPVIPAKALTSTPHARGSTLEAEREAARERVYPACAGIHLEKALADRISFGLPRMRGDPPLSAGDLHRHLRSTPHARGSTWIEEEYGEKRKVYPACAGIHPTSMHGSGTGPRLPRMRGDPPDEFQRKTKEVASTPHARGSTRHRQAHRGAGWVYPACAGIHLASATA